MAISPVDIQRSCVTSSWTWCYDASAAAKVVEFKRSDNMTVASDLTPERRSAVLRELEMILDSAPFRGSKRCQQFLRYVVEHALNGDLDQLKERSIGIAIFGRTVTYDTGDDAIVRVAAKGVRGRLLQYYAGLIASPPLRVDLPPGTYVPEIHWSSEIDLESAHPIGARVSRPRGYGWQRVAVAVAAIAVVVLAVVVSVRARIPDDMVTRFWSPALRSPDPVLICLAGPLVYRVDDGVYRRFGSNGPFGVQPAPVPDDAVVFGRDLVPYQNEYVGTGDALAATRLSALFARSGKAIQVRGNIDVSFPDLRTSPSVLIGAFSNPWTLEMMKDWRFYFDTAGGFLLRDRSNPTRVWENPAHRQRLRGRKITEDFGLITRVVDQTSGQPLIAVAGLSEFGTTAAAEFLSDNALLSTAFRDAPAGWERKNLQIIIRTGVKGRTAGVPQFVARHIW